MYVCLCHAITEKELNSLIKNGHSSLDKLRKTCGLGSSCGTCLQTAQKILLERKYMIGPKKQVPKSGGYS